MVFEKDNDYKFVFSNAELTVYSIDDSDGVFLSGKFVDSRGFERRCFIPVKNISYFYSLGKHTDGKNIRHSDN